MRAALALVTLGLALPASAIERIRLQAEQIDAAGATATGVDATLHILSDTRSRVAVRARQLRPPADIALHTGVLDTVELHCDNPQVREPLFACPAFRLSATSSEWGSQRARGEVSLRSDTGALQMQGEGPQLAGAPLRFAVGYDTAGLVASAGLDGLRIDELATLAARFAPLPEGFTATGQGDARANFSQRDGRMLAGLSFALTDGGYQNADYTWIGERLAFTASAEIDLSTDPSPVTVHAAGRSGQALLGPVMLDFDRNPWTLSLTAHHDAGRIEITALDSLQQDLARVSGTASVALDPFQVSAADVRIDDIRFPAAYASYLQIPLATTAFNQLVTSGRAEASVRIRDNAPTHFDLLVHELDFSDPAKDLAVIGVNAALHWTADVTDPRASWLSWENSRGWGIVGAPSRIDFTTSDRDFQLLRPARLPFFDGALRISRFAVEDIGSEQLSGVFEAEIEPISVGPVALAFGLPEFSGTLSGRIPGLTYRDGVLGVQGNIEADVFDGRVVASNLSVRDPFGAWPRLHADITARNLDLDLITRTFEVGSITGRLDVDLTGLETFNWTPVSFDLKLATPPGDRSRRRISQRAVQSLSDIGGGGGGVAAALQSGALKFFDDFGYARLGISCRLRNDVCQMDGVGNTGDGGFYLVRGSGLPRINIIGNNRRVDWPLLMQQVRDALANPEGIDVN